MPNTLFGDITTGEGQWVPRLNNQFGVETAAAVGGKATIKNTLGHRIRQALGSNSASFCHDRCRQRQLAVTKSLPFPQKVLACRLSDLLGGSREATGQGYYMQDEASHAQLFFQSLLMSSSVLPFVSGTNFQTKMAAMIQMMP